MPSPRIILATLVLIAVNGALLPQEGIDEATAILFFNDTGTGGVFAWATHDGSSTPLPDTGTFTLSGSDLTFSTGPTGVLTDELMILSAGSDTYTFARS